MIYSDEDALDDRGRRRAPLFKPDWAPETFRAMNYVGNLAAFDLRLVREVGGFRPAFGPAAALRPRPARRRENRPHSPRSAGAVPRPAGDAFDRRRRERPGRAGASRPAWRRRRGGAGTGPADATGPLHGRPAAGLDRHPVEGPAAPAGPMRRNAPRRRLPESRDPAGGHRQRHARRAGHERRASPAGRASASCTGSAGRSTTPPSTTSPPARPAGRPSPSSTTTRRSSRRIGWSGCWNTPCGRRSGRRGRSSSTPMERSSTPGSFSAS